MKEIRTEYDLGMIFRKFGSKYEKRHNLTSVQRKSFRAISVCRTSYLGGHIEKCLSCGHEHPVYNSCRNANCPKCQGIQRRKWLNKRLSEVLPVPYFHLIFTLPKILSELYFYNQSLIGGILFRTSADTILNLSKKYFNGTPHITSLIHTWGQTMSRHVHIHMLVTSGGLSKSRTEWMSHSADYLFDVKEISCKFRARFLLKLKRAILNKKVNFVNHSEITVKNINNIFTENWVVNSRKPFGGAEKVLEYSCNYICPVCGNDSFSTIKGLSAERSPPFKFRNEREYINVHAA